MSTEETVNADQIYCGRCGSAVTSPGICSTACAAALALEPPRFCTQCARRMKVQVDPFGWQAVCVEHGTIRS